MATKDTKITEGALQKELYALRRKLADLYKQKLMGELKQTHLIKYTKKQIARVLTKINQLKKKKNGA